MYFNVFGEKISRARYRDMVNAAKNRRELIAAGLTSRRDLFKLGLLTAGGMLLAKNGLSAQIPLSPQSSGGLNTSPGTNQSCLPGNQTASPYTRAFVEPLTMMPLAQPVPRLTPAHTFAPNVAAGEVRAGDDQAFSQFPAQKFYEIRQHPITVKQSPDLPPQCIWGYDDGKNGGISPGATYQAFYGQPIIVRNHNDLPPITMKNNTGFGLPSVSTHLHNAHNPSESDGNPCDFYSNGHFCDQHYANVLAGFSSTNPPNGDINESLSTLWYHDHRVDFTSQNTYKGLAGMYCLFNEFDTGNEDTGFRLPSFPQFDIPLLFADKVYDPDNGELVFDLFNLDGILGDKFLVNGKIQPFFHVEPRRYRFRLLDTGPSRFYEFYLTDLNNLNDTNAYFVIANDGNLLPNPVQTPSVRIGPAERVDIIIDFSKFAGKTIYLENRLNQLNGQGPVDNFGPNNTSQECSAILGSTIPQIQPAGQGNLILQFRVGSRATQDNSVDPSTNPSFYSLPSTAATPRIVRTFKFDRLNGQWSVNGQFMDCTQFRFAVQQNSVEQWLLTNLTGDWTHPVHIHLEEHQILSRNRMPPPLAIERSRKDVTELHPNERVQLFFRFRDWLGKYPIHCHNVVHEDHAMMALWHVVAEGDNVNVP
jgi:FtsP/CotA-like multicopper oxidase with cupredoxin domain